MYKDLAGFDWDTGNVDKSFKKHGITSEEAEEAFIDKNSLHVKDYKHAAIEERFLVFGKTGKAKLLTVSFTIRGNLIRIISARRANKKERRLYETKKV